MIKINLLPDVKQELIRTQRMRNVVVSTSILVGAAAVGVVVLLGIILLAQVGLEKIAQNSINEKYAKLNRTENISDLVTIQNQLTKISSINSKRSVDSRIFDVLQAVNPPAPNNVQFSSVKLDPTTSTLFVDGKASGGYQAVDTLKKSIQNATVISNQGSSQIETPLATEVIVGDTALGQATDGGRVVSFNLKVKYVSGLFSNSLTQVNIVMPQGTVNVTDSRTRVPDSLFASPVDTKTEGAQ